MAIMLDGMQLVKTTKPASTKVTYKPPTNQMKNLFNSYAQPQFNQALEEQKRRQAEAQRMQAMADAYKKQQQQARNISPFGMQTDVFNKPIPGPQTMPTGATLNMGAQQQSQQAQNAYAQRYQQQAQQYGQQNASPTRPYNAVTNPTGFKSGMDYVRTLPNDWREQNASVLMTPNEWLRRRNAWEKQYGNIFVSETEWHKRNAAAPPGYMWTPFGTGYAKLDTSSQQTAPANTGSGGGYGDWGYPDYGGGGGGSTYTPKPPEWWVEMIQWRI